MFSYLTLILNLMLPYLMLPFLFCPGGIVGMIVLALPSVEGLLPNHRSSSDVHLSAHPAFQLTLATVFEQRASRLTSPTLTILT